MKLPKIPIDYSKAGTGEAPFDGSSYLIHSDDVVIGECVYDGGRLRHLDSSQVVVDIHVTYFDGKCSIPCDAPNATHYTPMPEFEEVKG